jgi:hypothetical protein
MRKNTENQTNHIRTLNECQRFVTIVILAIPVLLLCSCSALTGKYNYGFAGDPRPGEEATLTAHETDDGPRIVKPSIILDDHHGQIQMLHSSFEVRLLPGTHKIKVFGQFGQDWRGSPYVVHPRFGIFVTFEAIAGRHYELKVNVIDFQKTPFFSLTTVAGHVKVNVKVIEVETGKEFPMDAASP